MSSPIGLDTRKPIDRLTLEDFAAFPIWEFAHDEETLEGRDETWVRPVDSLIVERDLASLSVAADFESVSGRRFAGFVGLAVGLDAQDSVEVVSAVVLADRKYIFAWPTFGGGRAEVAAQLEMGDEESFPLRYNLRVLVRGESTKREGLLKKSPPLLGSIRIPLPPGGFRR